MRVYVYACSFPAVQVREHSTDTILREVIKVPVDARATAQAIVTTRHSKGQAAHTSPHKLCAAPVPIGAKANTFSLLDFCNL